MLLLDHKVLFLKSQLSNKAAFQLVSIQKYYFLYEHPLEFCFNGEI
jgi:hypothetical protein